jgi:hypothetical protein
MLLGAGTELAALEARFSSSAARRDELAQLVGKVGQFLVAQFQQALDLAVGYGQLHDLAAAVGGDDGQVAVGRARLIIGDRGGPVAGQGDALGRAHRDAAVGAVADLDVHIGRQLVDQPALDVLGAGAVGARHLGARDVDVQGVDLLEQVVDAVDVGADAVVGVLDLARQRRGDALALAEEVLDLGHGAAAQQGRGRIVHRHGEGGVDVVQSREIVVRGGRVAEQLLGVVHGGGDHAGRPVSEAPFRLAAAMNLSVARLMASMLTPTPMPFDTRFDWAIVLRT